jgi:hypothetical protein
MLQTAGVNDITSNARKRTNKEREQKKNIKQLQIIKYTSNTSKIL